MFFSFFTLFYCCLRYGQDVLISQFDNEQYVETHNQREIFNINQFPTTNMAQGNGNFKHHPEPSVLKQATNQPCLPQKLSESQGPPKVYKNMLQIGNTTNSKSQFESHDLITKPMMEKNGANDKSLERLKQQIHQLQADDSRQAYLRYESQAFMIRKKRNNLFRVTDKTIPEASLTTTSRLLTFDMKLAGKKPGNKNAIKLQKLLKSFFEDGLQDSTDNRFLQFISMKHKLQLEEDEIKNTKSAYYTESEISRIKKYFVNPNKLPFMGIQFDFQNNEDDVSELSKIVENPTDYNEEEIDCFVERPEVSGYIIPETNLFLEFLNENKKQLFKGAKLLNRLRTQKEGILKRIAYQCVRQVDKRYKKCLKHQNDFINRAKKIHRQSLLYWRKRDKDLNELKKKKEKIEAQIKRKNQEKQQEETQKKKLEYLMKQSVLYSHFMAKKLGMQSENNHELFGEEDDKKIEIDQEAAELNVNQMISKKMDKLQKFDNGAGDNLDLSKVDVQDEQAQITGPPKIFIGKLKDYQVKGLKWLYNLNLQGINGILADEMGLGKTIQAIALLSHISYTKNKWGPFLIVSPSSTLHNWQQQFGRFCPTLKILPYWGNIKQRKVIRKYFSTKKFTSKHDSHFHVVITSYQMAVMDEKTFKRIKWQFIILDEAHNIKNTMSQRWNVLKEFESRSRLLLTGTPIQNNMAQLWALLNFIMPQLFDSHEQFNEWFSKDIEAHSQDQKELDKIQIQRLHAILKPFMLRRVKKDVEHEIGKKYENRILCEMTKRQKILYESIKEKLNVKQLFKMLESKSKVENLMNLVMQLRKVCNHPELFERRPPNSPYMFQQIYYYTGSTPIKNNQIKILSFNSVNPIRFHLPRLVYEDLMRKQQNLDHRNKRMLNLYETNNMRNSKGLSFFNLMNISLSLIQTCFRQDQLYTAIILSHLLTKNIKPSFSTDEFINLPPRQFDQRFTFNHKFDAVNHLNKLIIPIASAPTIIPIISSSSFYNLHSQLSNNKFQKYIMEGKYQQQFSSSLPIPKYPGILPKDEFLTKIELVNFGSLIADSAKLKQLDKILKEKRANGDKVLIFCQMTRMLDILEDFMNMKKYPFFRLDGACSLSDRRDMVNQFQKENSRVFAFLLSTRAGGLGVTLTAANNVIFYDNDWNPTMDAQATDRAHRIGQTRDVYVYQLVTMGTIEDRIVKRAEQKKTVQSTVYEGAALNIFKKDMIMQLMADELGVEQNEENKKEEVVKKRGPKATKPTIGITKQKITA